MSVMHTFGIDWFTFMINAAVGLLVLGVVIFWVIELVDCLRREFREPSEKIVWVLVIILAHAVGALIYWIMGKSRGTLPAKTE